MADDGSIELASLEGLLGPRTRLVAVTHVSNVLGTVLPIPAIAQLAHAAGARILVDGCQAVAHRPLDVQALGVDFYAFSAHKMYGPTGIGALWGRRELLADMPPYQVAGEMIARVSFEQTTFRAPPHRFEAGTPPIIEAIGFSAACDYLTRWTRSRRCARARPARLCGRATESCARLASSCGRRPRRDGAGRHYFFRRRRRASARCCNRSRRLGSCRPRRPPLRAAADAATWGGGNGPLVVWSL